MKCASLGIGPLLGLSLMSSAAAATSDDGQYAVPGKLVYAGGTELTLDNRIGGYMKGGFGTWPQAADRMLSDVVARLKSFAETGKAVAGEGK